MKINGNLDMQDNAVMHMRLAMESGFPAAPQPGRFLFREEDRMLYVCAAVDTLPIWIPCAQVKDFYRHDQNVAALEWTVEHDLNVNPVLVQVYDAAGNWVIPDAVICNSPTRATVRFNTPIAGTAVALRGSMYGFSGAAIAFRADFTAETVWTVNHSLGYNPDIKVYVGDKMVQPASIVHNDNMTTVVTFTEAQTGFVTCA